MIQVSAMPEQSYIVTVTSPTWAKPSRETAVDGIEPEKRSGAGCACVADGNPKWCGGCIRARHL